MALPSLRIPTPLPETTAVRDLEVAMGKIIQGKPEVIRAAIIALLARGHLLIEDVPGVGKTTLSRALAMALGGSFRRIQFTSDLLPSDILGVSVFDQQGRVFEFKRGPLFANVVLADELNRTTPRTQSALLEAMSDGQVSVDGVTHTLEQPFLVMATQNPLEQYGTYPLPESQLDRFLFRLSVGYPDRNIERTILRDRSSRDPLAGQGAVVALDDIRQLQATVPQLAVDDSLVDYAMAIVEATRKHPQIAVGVSTRGALAWYRGAQASALVDGRDYCLPDDFKRWAVPALAHRLTLHDHAGDANRSTAERLVRELIERQAIPS